MHLRHLVDLTIILVKLINIEEATSSNVFIRCKGSSASHLTNTVTLRDGNFPILSTQRVNYGELKPSVLCLAAIHIDEHHPVVRAPHIQAVVGRLPHHIGRPGRGGAHCWSNEFWVVWIIWVFSLLGLRIRTPVKHRVTHIPVVYRIPSVLSARPVVVCDVNRSVRREATKDEDISTRHRLLFDHHHSRRHTSWSRFSRRCRSWSCWSRSIGGGWARWW